MVERALRQDQAGRRETTTRSGRLRGIEQYSASRVLFTRFDYTTGDAADQNLTGKATAAACGWITANYAGITNFYVESNFATDKKSSQVNILRTRGKRVVAEATIPSSLIEAHMQYEQREALPSSRGVEPRRLHVRGQQQRRPLRKRNRRLFIATGQDAANVAESSAALGFSELLPNGDYYASITIPSLIVATYGGGTGLATQRECLELIDCYGAGKVRKLAEIMAASPRSGSGHTTSSVATEPRPSRRDSVLVVDHAERLAGLLRATNVLTGPRCNPS